MPATRMTPRGWFLSLLTVALVASAAGKPYASDTNPSLDSLKALEQKTVSLVPPLVEATVALSIVGGPGMGSGVIVSEDGLILTAGHVVPAAGHDMIVHFSNGKTAKAKALGADKGVDAGMAQITDKGTWPHVKVGKASELKKGDWIIAIGNPGGFRSDRRPPVRLGRILYLPDKKSVSPWIQTDATVAPGDSGGPLFNLQGEVVGIHSNISPDVTENRHVASDDYLSRWESLKSGKQVGRMFGLKRTRRYELGIQPKDVDGKVMIEEVSPKSGAALAGLKTGDVILSLNGEEIKKATQVREKLGKMKSDAKISLSIQRDGEKQEIKDAELQPGPFVIENAPEELEEFLKKNGYKVGDNKYEYKPDAETEADFNKLWTRYGDQRARMLFSGPRISKSDSKAASTLLEGVANLSKPLNKSIVTFYSANDESKIVAFGTVVSKDGYVLTKASEVNGEIFCKVGGKEFDAKVVTTNKEFDVALVKVDTENLTPVHWSSQSDPAPGTLLVTPNYDGRPLALGVVSNAVREIGSSISANRAVLGIQFDMNTTEPMISEVTKAGPADKAGLKKGDIILSIDGKKLDTREKTQASLKPKNPGDKIKIEVRRDDEVLKLEVTLGERNQTFGDMQERLRRRDGQARVFETAARTSKRKEDFPEALTHDSALWANQCGGPLLNLAGQAVGVNIARFDRTGSYALTYKTLQPVLDKMMDKAKAKPAKATSDKDSD